MRPIRLDMDGFASFRSATTVDFTDAEYFALVGPTGAGKSTVIDALVFALFGTAPRWGDIKAIKDGLSPNATRGTVRLVFEVGSNRYQIVRELRRTTQGVQQKSVMLERFLDPETIGRDAEVEVMASELSELKAAIDDLLGITYKNFTQAVVLPQGKFAKFLSDPPRERRETLLKLLGADQYDKIRKAASERSIEAERVGKQLQSQLVEFGDATPDAVSGAESRLAELTDLEAVTTEALAALDALRVTAAEASGAREAVERDAALVGTVIAPEGVGELAERVASLGAEATERRAEQEAAERHWDNARDELAAAGNRAELERVRALWAEAADLEERLPGLVDAADAARQAAADAQAERDRADVEARAAATRAGDLRRALVDASQAERQAASIRATLTAVRVPPGVSDVAATVAAAAREADDATQALAAAERAHDECLAAQVDPAEEAETQRTLAALAEEARLADELANLDAAEEAQRTAAEAQRVRLDAAQDVLRASEAELERQQTESAAAELRAHMAVGDHCPVCTQVVTALPDPAPAGSLDAARQRVKQSREAHSQAVKAWQDADRALAAASTKAAAKREALETIRAGIQARHPDADRSALSGVLGATLTRAAEARAATKDALDALTAARARRNAASAASKEATSASQSAWEGLRTSRGALVALGAPTDEPGDLSEAWQRLVDWAASSLAHLDAEELPRLVKATARAAEESRAADEAEKQAQEVVLAKGRATTAADRADAEASGAAARASERLARVRDSLHDAPGPDAAADGLLALERAEAREREARVTFDQARERTKQAEQARALVETEAKEARSALGRTRDLLVPLGSPPLDDVDLASGWATLEAWAADQANRLAAALDVARSTEEAAARSVSDAEEAVMARVSAAQVEAQASTQIPAAMGRALEGARHRLAGARERLTRRRQLEARLEKVTEEQAVAGLLADSLRADKFQEWLAGAALDALVDAASPTLHELSGGQYALTHDKGEFYVIDHEDAEARRSVKTLSGGETFQTSLALALALSDQLSSLSSSAKLESLFLDEGFGTLDADSLETVAVTLERLAQGDRMVGLVTHVPALAERVPTRFVVTRDSRSSRVEREG